MLKQHIQNILHLKRVLEFVGTVPFQEINMKKLQDRLEKKKQETERCKELRMMLYSDMKEGIVSKEDYVELHDDYKDGRMDRDLYKQRAEKISGQLDEIKRKIEDAENSKKFLEQNELSDKIKLKDFLGIQKFDTEKLREVIKVIRVHSQDEIEIEWNFDDIFSEQR